jgi:hypothetical protein
MVAGHWTYSGDPSATSRDAIRYLARDHDETDPKISDEEIAWELSEQPNIYLAAANVAEIIGGNFASKAKTKTVGSLSITYEARSADYKSLAASLRLRARSGAASGGSPIPYAGGISITDKEATESDSDWAKPAFSVGMHDYPGSS